MTEEQGEQLVTAVVTFLDSLGTAAKGIYEEAKRVSNRVWPEKAGPVRDGVLSRVPNAADKAREDQGATDTRPIRQWASDLDEDDEPVVGIREREWLKDHPEEKPEQPPRSHTGGQAG